MNRIASTLVAATVLLTASIAPAAAEVVRLEITDKTPYGTFRPGKYVLWCGVANHRTLGMTATLVVRRSR